MITVKKELKEDQEQYLICTPEGWDTELSIYLLPLLLDKNQQEQEGKNCMARCLALVKLPWVTKENYKPLVRLDDSLLKEKLGTDGWQWLVTTQQDTLKEIEIVESSN